MTDAHNSTDNEMYNSCGGKILLANEYRILSTLFVVLPWQHLQMPAVPHSHQEHQAKPVRSPVGGCVGGCLGGCLG